MIKLSVHLHNECNDSVIMPLGIIRFEIYWKH